MQNIFVFSVSLESENISIESEDIRIQNSVIIQMSSDSKLIENPNIKTQR